MRVLGTCLPGHGHFNPMLAVARALADAGHEVAFATAADFCPRVEAAGFAAFPAGMSLAEQVEEARRRFPEEDRLPGRARFEAFVPRMLAGVAAPSRAAELVAAVRRWEPDLLVHDETELAGPIAASVAGIPWADQSVGILRPLAMFRLAAELLRPLWDRWAVDLGPLAGMFRHLYLDVCPPSLQSPEIDSIEVAHLVKNVDIPPAPGETLPEWLPELPDVPTVYVSLGTIFNRDVSVYGAILDGLREQDLNVIVTVGNQNDPAALGPQPPNVHVERFIAQALLLPYCDLVVNQGGTAILPVLAYGLPLLVLPQSANQFHNADALVAAGVARRLLPTEVTPEAVGAEVGELLADAAYRERGARLAAEIEAMPGPHEGVSLLERLARERRPILRPAPSGSSVP
ncbi:MAG TPA: nucleotide disphospho-sugar-binding domain-containing protein [Acidimicrobiales bacterium]|nr:nucleotide disphospho-sugar-binding domain-containing protein [Acidimicrobiales bacterium]